MHDIKLDFAAAYYLFLDTAEAFTVRLKDSTKSFAVDGFKYPRGNVFPKFPEEAFQTERDIHQADHKYVFANSPQVLRER